MKMEHNKILITPVENLSHFMLLFSCHLLTDMCIYIHTHTHTQTYIHTYIQCIKVKILETVKCGVQ